jgi:hypothetical protein
MSALEHSDEAAVDRFTDAVDAALVRGSAGKQAITLRLMGMWVVAGVFLTLAVLANDALSTVLYIIGFALLAVALAGPLRGAATDEIGGG